jgi:hypothetical protein
MCFLGFYHINKYMIHSVFLFEYVCNNHTFMSLFSFKYFMRLLYMEERCQILIPVCYVVPKIRVSPALMIL